MGEDQGQYWPPIGESLLKTTLVLEEVIVGNVVDVETVIRASEDMDTICLVPCFSTRQGR